MLRIIIQILVWLLVALPVTGQEIAFPENGEFYLINAVDKPTLASLPERQEWQKHRFAGLPFKYDNYWVQTDFVLTEVSTTHLGIFISLLGAYEVYWDGVLIGKNGKVSEQKSTEVPGNIEAVFLLAPDQLKPGRHTLSILGSSHYIPESSGSGLFYTFVDEYETLVTLTYKRATIPMMMSGALLLIGAYCLFLYLRAFREQSYLWFSALCLVVLSLYVAESWRGLWGYSYDWHIPRLQIVLTLSCLAGVLISLFYADFFKLENRYKYLWVGASVVAQGITLTMFDGYDDRSLYVFMIGISASMMITLQAILLKREHARLMLAALVILVAPIYLNTRLYMEQYFFISFTVLIGFMLYSMTRTFRDKQQQLITSQLNAARLELQLVKRNLQPHFILNTLTAVEEWIEESPKTAVEFIQALADEFRYMAQLSSCDVISLKDEVALCQAHLKVMGYRANVTFALNLGDLALETELPPGLILTLIENAISHNHYLSGEVAFSLSQRDVDDALVLIFSAPVKGNSSSSSVSTGTGMKYIHTSLSQHYSQQGKCEERINDQLWEVTLTIPRTPGINKPAQRAK